MTLTVNGEKREMGEARSVLDLVQALGLEGAVAVEVNRSIVTKAEHATFLLHDGDVVEIVRFVGGG